MPMSPALRHKLAILGATYARALENAATRGGRALSPAMSDKLTAMRAQPQARLQRGLSDMFREHATGGELPMTPQRAQMQDLARRMPWASDEHTSDAMSAKAEGRFNRLLDRRGLSSQTPAGQPSTHEQINQAFGDPTEFRRSLYRADETQSGVAAPPRGEPTAVLSKRSPGLQGAIPRLPTNAPSLSDAPPPAVAHALTNVSNPRAHAPTAPMTFSGAPAGGAALPAPSAAPRQFPRARFQMGKVGALMPKLPGLPALAGAGIPLALGGAMLARKPGVQASIRAMQEGGTTQERDIAGAIPQEALDQADAIHKTLLAHGIDPATVRMGIDAPPGSGKTTLAKALHQKTGIKHYGLDWLPGNALHSTVGLGRNIEKMPRAPHAGEVLEHYMLGRTYDPELFDAMVHIRRDPEVLKKQLQQRGHGGYIGDTMDLNKSLGVADLGFDTLGGDVVDLGNGVQMKLRPREGWGNTLDDQLAQRGIDAHDLSRHEKLLSLHAGQRTTGAGWTPYAKNPFSTGETLALGASIPLGIAAARSLARRVPKVAAVADLWHDLSPLARRALVGGGVGAATGALADDEHRASGALMGGLAGTGAGVLYNHVRPIKPAAMPGTYNATFFPRIRTRQHDYETLFPPGKGPTHAPPKNYPSTATEAFSADHDLPSHDRAGRPIHLHAYPQVGADASHLTMRSPIRSETWNDLASLASDAYDGPSDVFREIGDSLPTQPIELQYGGSLRHDASASPEINEMRRLLRRQR